MSIKPQYESYRYTSEITRLTAQSVVECRLPGSEIGNVLAVQAKACQTECSCVDGEVRYSGKLLLCVVYEDGERKVCRAERGAEFYHKAESDKVTPACFAKPVLSVLSTRHRREGSGLYISVVIGAEIGVYGAKGLDYLENGENLLLQKQPKTLCKTLCVSGETEGEDEFETSGIRDVLLHAEETLVHRVVVGVGTLDVEGEMVLNACALKTDDTLCAIERVIPFKVSIPCEDAYGEVTARAIAEVKSSHLKISVDEEDSAGKMLLSYALAVHCYLYTKENLTLAVDAFSPVCEISLKTGKQAGRYLTNTLKCVERVNGVATLNMPADGEYALCCATLPKAEVSCRRIETGYEAEGVVTAEIILKHADGGYKTATLTLPFLFPVNAVGDCVQASAVVCGLNVLRQKDGVAEAEALVKLCLHAYEESEFTYLEQVEEGELCEQKSFGVSIYALREGDDLWQASKRLKFDPEELQKSNPHLQFPVKEGERIIVYRQIK